MDEAKLKIIFVRGELKGAVFIYYYNLVIFRWEKCLIDYFTYDVEL